MENGSPDIKKEYLVWLEPEHLHFHEGGPANVRALKGKMMQRDGNPDMAGWTGYALDPEGIRLDVEITRGTGNHYRVVFFAGVEGIFNLVLESGPDRARIAVPVGHHAHGPLTGLNTRGLDVFVTEFREYHPGDSVAIMVLYNGKPLPGAEIAATYHLYTGVEYPWRGRTGEDGSVNFTFTRKGHWMFVCSHTDQILYTSTFVVAGVR